MTRPKFRVWDNTEREWFAGTFTVTGLGVLVVHVPETGYSPVSETAWDNRFVLEQWTGLSDDDGKDIYEGDICGYPGAQDPSFEVLFENAAFRKRYAKWDPTIRRVQIEEHDVRVMGIRVIGNVHEQPELLASADDSAARADA